jgi:hypothetical protein
VEENTTRSPKRVGDSTTTGVPAWIETEASVEDSTTRFVKTPEKTRVAVVEDSTTHSEVPLVQRSNGLPLVSQATAPPPSAADLRRRVQALPYGLQGPIAKLAKISGPQLSLFKQEGRRLTEEKLRRLAAVLDEHEQADDTAPASAGSLPEFASSTACRRTRLLLRQWVDQNGLGSHRHLAERAAIGEPRLLRFLRDDPELGAIYAEELARLDAVLEQDLSAAGKKRAAS